MWCIMSIAMDWNDDLISNVYTKLFREHASNAKSSEGNWKN